MLFKGNYRHRSAVKNCIVFNVILGIVPRRHPPFFLKKKRSKDDSSNSFFIFFSVVIIYVVYYLNCIIRHLSNDK